MDMKATLGMNEIKARAEQLRQEILSMLATGPLTTREMYDRSEIAESLEQITNQIGRMRQSGVIVPHGIRNPGVIKQGVKPAATYALATPDAEIEEKDQEPETSRLAAAIEAMLPTPSFAAQHIAQLDDPEPRIIEARWIAEMIGAIATRLEAGRSLPPDQETARLLREAEQVLMECAA